MTEEQKKVVRYMRVLGWFVFMTCAFVVVATTIHRDTVVFDTYHPVQPHIPKGCWTHGNNHPIPGHVIYNGHRFGSVVTGKALDAYVDGAHNGINPSFITAFCK